MQHIYQVHPVECQPQWSANDNQPPANQPDLALCFAIFSISAGAFVLFVLAVVGIV